MGIAHRKPQAITIWLPPSPTIKEFGIQVNATHKSYAPWMAACAPLLRDLLRDEAFCGTVVPAELAHHGLTAPGKDTTAFLSQIRAVTMPILRKALKWKRSYGYATVHSANIAASRNVSVVWSNANKWKTDDTAAHRDIACHLFHEMAHTLWLGTSMLTWCRTPASTALRRMQRGSPMP